LGRCSPLKKIMWSVGSVEDAKAAEIATVFL
jgi:hypothetical protein